MVGLRAIAIFLIRIYQRYISPLSPSSCRYSPSCSQYTIEAVEHYGLIRGLWMGFRRIMRCHPFYPGGYDPVIPPVNKKKEKDRRGT